MIRLRYEAPDGSLIDDPPVATLRNIVETSAADYWQQGGNGEAVLTVVGSRSMLLIKQPPGTDGYLLTYMDASDYLVPYSGESFDRFVWEERGGDPFKVPEACLVSRATATAIVTHFAETFSPSPDLEWIPWDDLPDSYHDM
jgi:hypothetical protein